MKRMLGIIIVLCLCVMGGYCFINMNNLIKDKSNKIHQLEKELLSSKDEIQKILEQNKILEEKKNELNKKLNVFLFPENRFKEATDKFEKGFFEDALIIFK